MTKLEDLKPGLQVKGIIPQQPVTVIDVKWHGSAAVELTYKRADGRTGNQLLYATDANDLKIVTTDRRWDFSGDGEHFRLAAEA